MERRACGGRHPSGHARRHVRRCLAATAHADQRWARGSPIGRQAPPLSRAPRGPRPRRADARRDVERRALATQASGGTSEHAPRPTGWRARNHGWRQPGRESARHESSAPARPHGRHPGAAADRVQLLHRERSLGIMVGRRLHDRAAELAAASTSATPTGSRARAKSSRSFRPSGSSSPTASTAAIPCRPAARG